MKEYVLDYPAPDGVPVSPVEAPELVAPPRRWWRSWRSLALLIVLESIALALLYVALIGFPAASPASAETVPVAAVGPVPSTATPVQAQAQQQARTQPPEEGDSSSQAAAAADPVEAVPSRIVRERGRYVIELHSAAIGPVLEMLTKATGATVRGSDVVLGNAARITRTVTTDSPLEAWQAVFGGVVNFAASCTRAACDVRFVRSADPALAARQQRLPSGAAPEPGSPDERDDQGTTAPAIAPSVVARTAPPAVPAPADDQPAAEN